MKVVFNLALLLATFVFYSCEGEKENPSNNSRILRYELTGNYSGTIIASYTTANGGTTNEQVSSTPWTKELTYSSNITAAILAVSGNGGTAGQELTIIVKRGNRQVSSTKVIANNIGSFTIATPVVTF